jgi:hypothetical protein
MLRMLLSIFAQFFIGSDSDFREHLYIIKLGIDVSGT